MKTFATFVALFALPASAQIAAWQHPTRPSIVVTNRPMQAARIRPGVTRPWVPVTVTNAVRVVKVPRPQFAAETNLIARASAALEQIAPNRPGVQTLMMIRQLPPERFIDLAKARLASAPPERKADIVAAALDVTALLKEAESKGLDWRSPEFGRPTSLTTNRTLKVIEQ